MKKAANQIPMMMIKIVLMMIINLPKTEMKKKKALTMAKRMRPL
ncbi:MAG: hypothetical protein Hyperionvirus6_4 [Hyperionvirus sp.]|uniref:Uncharacterized protein n=1 Tax=Hyperionvirus sp. TaxID=2487770 RepID=A0A3G5ABR7_9VIRU|nr:MAG: hypothetical protein Hyperionvirus6_4 [Hyperionvirus sp.]